MDRQIGLAQADKGFAAVYHEHGPDWSGPTGFYDRDLRAMPAEGRTITWPNLYVWAPLIYQDNQLELAIEGQFIGGMDFTLRLDTIPDGVAGAPPVGTTWEIPKDKSFALQLPTYRSDDGLTGYRFSVTMVSPGAPGGTTGPPGGTTGACLPVMAGPVLMLAVGVRRLTRPRVRR